MGSLTNYEENKILNNLVGHDTQASVSMWVGLFTTAPSDASGGTEVSGNNYGRKSSGAWTSAAAGLVANAAAITYATATAAWGEVTSFALFDDSATGNMIAWATLTAARTISTSDIAAFAIGSLTLAID